MKTKLSFVAAILTMAATGAMAIPDYDGIDLFAEGDGYKPLAKTANVFIDDILLENPGTDAGEFPEIQYGSDGAGPVADKASTLGLSLTDADLMAWVFTPLGTELVELQISRVFSPSSELAFFYVDLVPNTAGPQQGAFQYTSTSAMAYADIIATTPTIHIEISGLGGRELMGVALGVNYAQESVPEAGSTLAVLGLALLAVEGLRRKMRR